MSNLRPSMTRGQFARQLRTANKKLCKTGNDLGVVLRSIINLTEENVRNDIVKALTEEITKLLDATPKYTGRAAAGWQVVTAKDQVEFVPGVSPQEIAAAAVRAVPAAAELSRADKIWVVNNVEYILALNAGWSKQLPGGFIDNFILGLRDALAGVARNASAAR